MPITTYHTLQTAKQIAAAAIARGDLIPPPPPSRTINAMLLQKSRAKKKPTP